ncbi:flagellar hook-associated protein FlgK [Planctellipticum variicoloris]|uniref:flagellar hook-associated protein FlgK n=1 Tax=Planctellipticum variicoloris TaxID=3064265 RepID=UPI003013F0DE|nr:flagellar hook-associated protein FlgK [Planctomycetaceae bacterium SH412]
MSLNSALAIASSSLDLFSLGIQVAGNNINNSTTPGYVREKLIIQATPPSKSAGVLVGTGALAYGVKLQLDKFLEARIHVANTSVGLSSTRSGVYQQLQSALQTLGEGDLSNQFNTLMGQLQSVVNQPENASLRTAFVESGEQFATAVTQLRLKLTDLQNSQNDQLKSRVDEANTLIQKIKTLNPQIGQLEANGLGRNDAGALRVERMNAINRLSELMPIRAIERPSGSVDLYSGSDYLLLDGQVQKLNLFVDTRENGLQGLQVQLSQTRSILTTGGGEIRGTIEGRDKILGGFVTQLDEWAGAFINEFNKIHASGEGVAKFTDVTGVTHLYDSTSPLSTAGLPFPPKHGSFEIKTVNQATGITETAQIGIDLDGIGTDTSLTDLKNAIDAVPNLTATITTDGRLRIASAAGYEFSFSNDTSGVLASLGINTFFTGSSSGDIGVNQVVVDDPRYLATGRGGGPSDNSNAVALAQLPDVKHSSLGGSTLPQFFEQITGGIVQGAAAEDALAQGSENFRSSLTTQREQTSGVSLDEETIIMMQLQRNYQAAARIVTTVDQLLSTLLQI